MQSSEVHLLQSFFVYAGIDSSLLSKGTEPFPCHPERSPFSCHPEQSRSLVTIDAAGSGVKDLGYVFLTLLSRTD